MDCASFNHSVEQSLNIIGRMSISLMDIHYIRFYFAIGRGTVLKNATKWQQTKLIACNIKIVFNCKWQILTMNKFYVSLKTIIL